MPANLHGDTLAHTRSQHVPDCRAAEVVKDLVWGAGLLAGQGPSLSNATDLTADLPVEDPGNDDASGVLQLPGPCVLGSERIQEVRGEVGDPSLVVLGGARIMEYIALGKVYLVPLKPQ